MRKAFIFPGQGESHSIGMGKDFYDHFPVAKQAFEEACDHLKYDLTKLIFEGPLEKLSETKYCQIAIYVTCMAVLKVIHEQFPNLKPEFCAGLSLGEYTAATAAGVLTYQQGIALVHARGTFMQKACSDHPSTMAVVLGLNEQELENVLKLMARNDLWMANLNCPGQIVASGSHQGIEALAEPAKAAGAKRVLPLNVAGAFHSPLMQSAANELSHHLNPMKIHAPSCTFMMNVSGKKESDLEKIKKNLILQVTHPVRWQQSVESMVQEGAEYFIEIGCGKVLSGLNKRMGLSGQTCCINSIKDLELLSNLKITTSC